MTLVKQKKRQNQIPVKYIWYKNCKNNSDRSMEFCEIMLNKFNFFVLLLLTDEVPFYLHDMLNKYNKQQDQGV